MFGPRFETDGQQIQVSRFAKYDENDDDYDDAADDDAADDDDQDNDGSGDNVDDIFYHCRYNNGARITFVPYIKMQHNVYNPYRRI